ncbi:hypothetical protein PRABACTJOHN_01298 [Parabacteroides johnsonii DSM 18315]|uniref:Uncharacterized protein n=1 Tax=Parabacteroides johnsonii DSM 18315 TaxID=537006 RepID=B7B8E7_9BACT|nr:hypothetical protein PRABACTJOHN_01298 [Parabacteroides johnsonii DSM 18315]
MSAKSFEVIGGYYRQEIIFSFHCGNADDVKAIAIRIAGFEKDTPPLYIEMYRSYVALMHLFFVSLHLSLTL